jgi:hypothetical protein
MLLLCKGTQRFGSMQGFLDIKSFLALKKEEAERRGGLEDDEPVDCAQDRGADIGTEDLAPSHHPTPNSNDQSRSEHVNGHTFAKEEESLDLSGGDI